MHKKSKSVPPHLHTFYSFSPAAFKDTNIVKLNRIALHLYCLLKNCVIEWRMGLFFF